ncbi:MAG: ABC transporter permease [Thermoplasmata archaeon]|nr:ABC transporter permease [Thermoplasmata archaeon]
MATPPAEPPMAPPPEVGRSLDQSVKLARYQLRNYLRSRRYFLMMAIVAAVGVIYSLVIGYFRPASFISDPLTFYGAGWGNGVSFLIVVAGVIFGGDAIAGEFQSKTGYFLMGIPIRRSTIYVGKFFAAFAASLTAVIFFLAILLANGLYYFSVSAFPWELGASFLLAIVYLLALLGTTFLFSSLFKTRPYATLVVAVLFLFGFTILQELVVVLVKIEPWFLISYAGSILANVFVYPFPAHLMTVRGFDGSSMTVYTATLPEGIAILLLYFVITSLLGLFLFEREEFT